MAEYGEELSDRELDVLRCIARGASNKEVAAELHISENTVKVHLRRVFSKLGVASRTEATRVAIQLGLVIVPGIEIEMPTTGPTGSIEAFEPEMPSTDTVISAKPVTPSANLPPPARFPLWRVVSFVLAIFLMMTIVYLVRLRSAESEPVEGAESFREMNLGENWALTNRPLPEAMANMAMASVGLNIYVIGGETADSPRNTLYSFNTHEHIWQLLTPKPTAVTEATATELFGEIYVVGGRLANGQPTNIVEAYSPTQNAWRPVTALPHPIASGLALSDGSFLYLFGGRNGTEYLDTAYLYDPSADSWRPLPAMSQPRASATGQFMTGKLYIVGGFDGTQTLNSCEYYNPSQKQWLPCPTLLSARRGSASAVILNKLYVIGGSSNENQPVTYSEWYDPATTTWLVVNTPILKETPNWVGLGVANVENRIFALGGYLDNTLISDTYIYSPFIYRTYLPNISVEGN